MLHPFRAEAHRVWPPIRDTDHSRGRDLLETIFPIPRMVPNGRPLDRHQAFLRRCLGRRLDPLQRRDQGGRREAWNRQIHRGGGC